MQATILTFLHVFSPASGITMNGILLMLSSNGTATRTHNPEPQVYVSRTVPSFSTNKPFPKEWAAQYPPSGQMPLNGIPQPWLDALHDAEQAGLIPNITISTASNGSPVYLPSDNPDGPVICSSTWGCRMPDDIWDAPDGFVAIGFDDGPYDV